MGYRLLTSTDSDTVIRGTKGRGLHPGARPPPLFRTVRSESRPFAGPAAVSRPACRLHVCMRALRRTCGGLPSERPHGSCGPVRLCCGLPSCGGVPCCGNPDLFCFPPTHTHTQAALVGHCCWVSEPVRV